jgi:hypothetical protein
MRTLATRAARAAEFSAQIPAAQNRKTTGQPAATTANPRIVSQVGSYGRIEQPRYPTRIPASSLIRWSTEELGARTKKSATASPRPTDGRSALHESMSWRLVCPCLSEKLVETFDHLLDERF